MVRRLAAYVTYSIAIFAGCLLLSPLPFVNAFLVLPASTLPHHYRDASKHRAAATTLKAPPPPISAAAPSSARDELLVLLTLPQGGGGQEQAMAMGQRLDFLITQLEDTYVPPQTLPFMNLLLKGTWINVYNSWAMTKKLKNLPSMEDANEEEQEHIKSESKEVVELRGLTQDISPDLTKGGIMNRVEWEYVHEEDKGLAGNLVVKSQYEVNSRGIMEVGSVEHDLQLKRAPKNPGALIKGVQKVVPFDMFDPNATFVETAYIDHELRATKTHSTKFGTIKNMFVRNGTALHSQLQECGVC